MGVVHPGVVVDPLADLRRGTLSFELGGFGVDTGIPVTLRDQTLGQVAAGAVEHDDPLPGRRHQQLCLIPDEHGADFGVETTQHPGHRIDMVTRDHTGRQRVLERRHRVTGMTTTGDPHGVTGRTLALVTEQRLGRLGLPGRRQFRRAPRATHLDRRQPRPQLTRPAHDHRHLVTIRHRRIRHQQLGKRRLHRHFGLPSISPPRSARTICDNHAHRGVTLVRAWAAGYSPARPALASAWLGILPTRHRGVRECTRGMW